MIKMRCLLMLASTLCFMAAQAQPALVKKNGSHQRNAELCS